MNLDHLMMAVIVSGLAGVCTRIYLLQTDYRQYPTYPHGYIIHLALGIIAAGLGSVAIPALIKKDFTAFTFLALAAQQFRDVRNMERTMLTNIDGMELVPRGVSYIEGIAMVFEGRNYLTIASALITSFTVINWNVTVGVIVGIVCIVCSRFFMSGKMMSSIVEIREAKLRLDGASLYVEDIYLMNVGLSSDKKAIMENGIGMILTPKDASSRITLSNVGQRQAILHDVSTVLGVYRDTGEPALTPLGKLDLQDGRLGLLLLPQDRNVKRAIDIIGKVPVLESAMKKPLQANATRGGMS
ncbi:hypothetical protein SAMN04487866_101189 [Thermoactinomyces sp. DSM 45891]|uniref:YIEGIA family protein n=1 Tax=Thermoactinomyces sp. DSM 45891 TaxID=1761907 RepID=UPI000916AA66|nr:YIEGIA family protein [Thermoactinomyces sp. DSM 45891]SFX01219.1 hypothetical protein SAMN04487866_101189 [Thermoactinomyces sp. DSM 45891]